MPDLGEKNYSHHLYRMFIASLFDAHIRNIRNLNYSIYATFTVSAALELPADLAAIWGLNWLGRRWSAFLSLALSGGCMAVCGLCLSKLELAFRVLHLY